MGKNMTVVARIIVVILVLIISGGLIAGVIDLTNSKKSIHKPKGIYEAYFKRVIDFISGILVLVVLCPLYLVLAIMVRIKLGSPILFTQDRQVRMKKYLNFINSVL